MLGFYIAQYPRNFVLKALYNSYIIHVHAVSRSYYTHSQINYTARLYIGAIGLPSHVLIFTPEWGEAIIVKHLAQGHNAASIYAVNVI